MNETFQTRCCAYFGCLPEAFEDAVFWHCVFSQSRLRCRLMNVVNPGFFERDRSLIRALANVTSYAELENELLEFRDDYLPGGRLRQKWRMRVSTTKIARLAAKLFPDSLVPRKSGTTAVNKLNLSGKTAR